ncbi:MULTISPECIES: YsnF/AvaK domain-containing protein [unclassified Bacillus (in: firmicutes)]|uniref:YsnF/AvaK domain-containing protein n=1 Tax=unclassified Bacillus (in: firmicutes) TaxID=185979 RepID=UPI001BEB14CA|nr:MULTISPECIES: YsnF/AvaK domain-containing protein [unclassified Bacillus (in: firmicutes)]MBT2639307.1 YsnF/AvaK domain-containing protein [Bacillus sp. ISL-39]MBT2660493.1 YsnF/AvaK domain-containing protein [Bacillus sp. ISL-45]
MAKKVVGVYDNQTELIEAIEEYKNNGYAVQDFSIIGDTNDVTTALESRTGVTTENIGTDTDDRKEGGFWQSLMTAFDGDRNLGGNEPSVSDRLVGAGLTDDAAREYEEDVRNGRIILLAETTASGLDVEETGYVTDTSEVTGTYDDTDQQTLRLREEQLDVSKERVQAGEVEIHKEVVEEQQKVNIPVTREEVYVERRNVNETASATDAAMDDDETIRVPIMEEKVEVTKKPVVSEELVIGKREVTDTEQVVESVKHEEAHLEADDDRLVNEADRDRNRDSLKNSTDLDRDGYNNPSGMYRDGYKDRK